MCCQIFTYVPTGRRVPLLPEGTVKCAHMAMLACGIWLYICYAANSQRINEDGALAKIGIWVVKWYSQTLKTFRIITSEVNISLLILNWWFLSCLNIQIIGIQYTDQLLWKIMASES